MENQVKLVTWKFQSLKIGMVEVNSKLFCSTNALLTAIDVTRDHLARTIERHREEFNYLKELNGKDPVFNNINKVIYENQKEFVRENKKHLMVSRLRSDLSWWSEEEMLFFAIHCKSEKSIKFRYDLIHFIKTNATKCYVDIEEYGQIIKDNAYLKGAVMELQKVYLEMMPAA